jgi:site-specific DNA-cytosine methylase
VFLISVFDPATAARCPDPLLPVCEGVQWHPATGNTPRQTVTGETAASFGSSNFGGWAETDTAITLSQRDHKGSMTMVVGSLAARDYKGVGNQYVNEGKVVVEPFTKSKRPQSATDDETWVANQPNPTLNAFDQGDTRTTTVIVGEPVMLNYQGSKGNAVTTEDGVSFTLNAMHGHDVHVVTQPTEEPIVFENSYRDAARIAEHGITQTLTSKMGTGGGNTPMIAFPIQDGREMEKNQNGIGVADDGTPAYTIDRTGAQAVAYSVREDAKANTFSATELDKANSLSALRPSPQSHHAQMFIAEGTHNAVAYDEYNDSIGGEVHHALRAGTKQSTGVMTTMAVRRLTPLECERLMGWPDDWTAGQSDTHRYKQCGNGVASPVAQWIAQQLLQLDQ